MFPLSPRVAQRSDGCRRIPQQPVFDFWVAPGTSDNIRAIARADLGFVSVDKRVDGFRIDQTLLDQQRFERLDTQNQVRRRFGMIVVMSMMVFTHVGFLPENQRPP
jgi:hypothetical protein